MENRKDRLAWALGLGLTVLLLFGLAWLLWRSGFFTAIRSPDDTRRFIQRFAPYSHLVFFLLQFASVILAPIPSNLTAAAGGLLFGTIPAFLLTFTAVAAGSAAVFLLARSLSRPLVVRFVSPHSLQKYGEVLRRKRDCFLFLAFLFPFFPDDLLCILAGLSQISFRRFLALVLLARPWGLLAASAVGGSALTIPPWAMALLGLGSLLFFGLAMKFGDRLEAKIIDALKRS